MASIKTREEALVKLRQLHALRERAKILSESVSALQAEIVRFFETKNLKGMVDTENGLEYSKQLNTSTTYNDAGLTQLLMDKGREKSPKNPAVLYNQVYSTVINVVRDDNAIAELLRSGDIETEELLQFTTFHYSKPFIKATKKKGKK